MERELLEEVLEAALAMVLLGLTVAGLYALVLQSVPPATFFLGELVGLLLGIPLLVVAGPRRRPR